MFKLNSSGIKATSIDVVLFFFTGNFKQVFSRGRTVASGEKVWLDLKQLVMMHMRWLEKYYNNFQLCTRSPFVNCDHNVEPCSASFSVQFLEPFLCNVIKIFLFLLHSDIIY